MNAVRCYCYPGVWWLYQGFPLHMNLAMTLAKGSDNFNDATIKMAREQNRRLMQVCNIQCDGM